jgi:MFS family permease
MHNQPAHADLVDSRYAFKRLMLTLLIVTLGSSSMYVVAVVLPAVQLEFGVSRADASLPYTVMMLGLGIGGIYMGRWADRKGVHVPLFWGGLGVGSGFILAGLSQNIWLFALAHCVLLGMFGASSTFAPLLADTSLWWNKRRGIAVTWGWRSTYMALGVVCGLGMVGLSFFMRQRPPLLAVPVAGRASDWVSERPFGLRLSHAQALLCVAGVACCVAMAMPQVHIVAYCSDLGFGAARGAEMLSLMLACGIASRLISGVICDRIGGLRTLLLGSILQGVALLMFLFFDGLVSLYVISAMFGLFQGGIVPSYAIIVREYFPPKEAGARVGSVIFATMVGMALGGWMSGKVFDLTGSYHAAFINGLAWNLLNLSIATGLLWRVYKLSRPANAGG